MAYKHHKTLKSILILFFAMFGVLILMSLAYLLNVDNGIEQKPGLINIINNVE